VSGWITVDEALGLGRLPCATLFGDSAKDPKSTQAHCRRACPTIRLKHYQKSVPASVNAAAIAMENDLAGNIPSAF